MMVDLTSDSNVRTIGVVFGTFAPLHIGHQQEIYKAVAECGEAIVMVSGYKGDRGDKIGLPVRTRYRYLREAYADEPLIHVDMIDESKIPRYPGGWELWTRMLVDRVRANTTMSADEHVVQYVIYVGEQDYVDELKNQLSQGKLYYERWDVVKLDRSKIPVSATMIREDPMKHWTAINRVFRRRFTKKVLVLGSASTGKSTLVRRLARSINAPFSEEYARTYEESHNLKDEDLTVADYVSFLEGQDRANCDEVRSASNQGVVFFDTDAITTKTYAQLYLPSEDRKQWGAVADLYVNREDPDVILLIPPVTRYVDDGFRNMEWAKTVDEYYDALVKNIKLAGLWDRVVILDDAGSDEDPDGFYARYVHAKKAVESRLGVKMDLLD
jgi:NadR type nicotinamide-nucleotide adenylyltransferase